MTQSILYCFRNGIKESEEWIKKKIEQKDIEVSFTPTYCMKLCMFCANMNVAVVNRQVVMEKNEDQFIEQIVGKLE
jgi:uncharacterized protein YuzB (UPF0349 family)